MSNDTTLPVLKWKIVLESVADAKMAREGWLSWIRSQGWSPVGEPEVLQRPEYADFVVIGKIVKHPGLTIAASANWISIPA